MKKLLSWFWSTLRESPRLSTGCARHRGRERSAAASRRGRGTTTRSRSRSISAAPSGGEEALRPCRPRAGRAWPRRRAGARPASASWRRRISARALACASALARSSTAASSAGRSSAPARAPARPPWSGAGPRRWRARAATRRGASAGRLGQVAGELLRAEEGEDRRLDRPRDSTRRPRRAPVEEPRDRVAPAPCRRATPYCAPTRAHRASTSAWTCFSASSWRGPRSRPSRTASAPRRRRRPRPRRARTSRSAARSVSTLTWTRACARSSVTSCDTALLAREEAVEQLHLGRGVGDALVALHRLVDLGDHDARRGSPSSRAAGPRCGRPCRAPRAAPRGRSCRRSTWSWKNCDPPKCSRRKASPSAGGLFAE